MIESKQYVKRINQQSMELLSKDHDRLYSHDFSDREDIRAQHVYYPRFPSFLRGSSSAQVRGGGSSFQDEKHTFRPNPIASSRCGW